MIFASSIVVRPIISERKIKIFCVRHRHFSNNKSTLFFSISQFSRPNIMNDIFARDFLFVPDCSVFVTRFGRVAVVYPEREHKYGAEQRYGLLVEICGMHAKYIVILHLV